VTAAAVAAAARSATTLHARTVPLDYGPDALEFDGSPTVLFDRPGLTLVGWGTALLVPATEAPQALAAIPCDDAVGVLGSGPVALGALPFTDAFGGSLVVPRFTMGTSRDADGVTRRWATAVGPADVALPDTGELFDAVIWQYGTTPQARKPAEADAVELTTAMPSEGYAAMVAAAVAAMAPPGAVLRKVVLSRPVEVHLRGQLSLSAVLRRLRAGEPNCTIFSMPVPDGSFFGASPELLVARHGSRVSSHPLAGTVPRGDTARTDADAQRDLAGSAKNRAEHRYVVEDIAAVLAPFCEELTVPSEPSVVAFRSVAHLGTRIEGRLAQGAAGSGPAGVLELLERLHPTPAVGGTPRPDALAFIAEHEAGERGHWAGPVGWVGASGDGEWMIGIRSAQLGADGATLHLRAGGGIVADSMPDAEAAEANVKLATVLDAVVPGAAERLR
jgi:menaquinone-specific isochorismate synthase